MKYNPADAAKACNVSVNTIRGWIKDFPDHFTPDARGESGNRLLTDKDLNTLKYIAALRSEGLQRASIAQRLQETSIGEAETLVDMHPPSIVLQTAPESPDLTAALAVVVNDLEKRFDAKLEALEQSYRPNWWWLIAGIGIGLGLAVVFELAALVASRGH